MLMERRDSIFIERLDLKSSLNLDSIRRILSGLLDVVGIRGVGVRRLLERPETKGLAVFGFDSDVGRCCAINACERALLLTCSRIGGGPEGGQGKTAHDESLTDSLEIHFIWNNRIREHIK